jgi:hypothetical protein
MEAWNLIVNFIRKHPSKLKLLDAITKKNQAKAVKQVS